MDLKVNNQGDRMNYCVNVIYVLTVSQTIVDE